MTKDLKLKETIKASPADVYAAFTNKNIIEIWTGEEAEMSTIPGSEFSWFGGDIAGKNIEFEENKRIVQQWYFGDYNPSTVTIILHPSKQNTQLEVFLKGVPEIDADDISNGWHESIFSGLKELLEE
jgi:activator of HSP90 ATPase